MYYLGIDCGTQGTKAVVFSPEEGRVIGKGYESHPIHVGEHGEREQEVSWWKEALIHAVRRAVAASKVRAEEIAAISVSGQQHGLVLLDESGNPLRSVKLWNDTSTAAENDEIISSAGGMKAVSSLIGTSLPVGYTASKVLYVRRREAEVWKNVRHVLLPHDWINYYLTGEYFTDSSDASGTGYFSVRNGIYSSPMISILDSSGILEKALPEILPWNEGRKLRKEAAEELGLKEGTLVAAGGGDNTMSALGTSGIVPGRLTLSLGTSGTLCLSSKPKADGIDELLQVYRISDGFLSAICSLNATSATTSIQQLFSISIEELNRLLEETDIGSGGVIALQFFSGERVPPLPSSSGMLRNLTTANLTRGNIVRSVAEACIFTLRYGYERMMQSFSAPDMMIMTGGGCNSAAWRRIASAILRLDGEVLESDEGGALGAALQAMYLHLHSNGEAVSPEGLAKRYVKFRKECFTPVVSSEAERYDECYYRWKEALNKEWGDVLLE